MTKKGSIGEEIIRLVSARSEDGKTIPPLLTSAAIGFAHFILMLVAFNPTFEEPPELGDVWAVLNGSDLLRHIGLMNALNLFIPVWLDMELQDNLTDFHATNITDAYNKFVIATKGDGENA